MTRVLPPQSPIQPPRYRFRPRSDKGYRIPVGQIRSVREYREPEETYDPRNEARDLDWRELTPGTLIGGLLLFVVVVAAIVGMSVIGYEP